MTVTSLRIEEWGGRYIVVGEFESHTEIHRKEFTTYLDALREMSKILGREVMRREHNFNSGFNR